MTTSTAYPPSRRARGFALETLYEPSAKNAASSRPVRITIFAQGGHGVSYSSAKRRIYSSAEAGLLYGYTSPIYLIARSLFPAFGGGVGSIPVYVYPLSVATGVQSAGSITPLGTMTKTQKYYVEVNNLRSKPITMVSGDSVAEFITKAIAAINGVLGMPGTASDGTTKVNFTAGFDGDTGDNIHLNVVYPDDAEMTFSYVQPTGGGGTIAVDATGEGLNLVGEAWDTHFINALDYTDSDNLDAFDLFGEGRWDPEVKKPCVVFTGCNEATLATVTAVTDARKSDRTNCIVVNPGSNDLPFMIAAEHVRKIANVASLIPAHDYGAQKLTMLTPALDHIQWNSDSRQAAIEAGCSSIVVIDDAVEISDVVTCYHPTGEDPPAFSYVCDFEKLSAMIHMFNEEFMAAKWRGGPPMVPNDQAVSERSAKKPKDAGAAIADIYRRAGLSAIISDPDWGLANSSWDISSVNPKRLDIIARFKLSGNANVIAVTMPFSFYYGGQS